MSSPKGMSLEREGTKKKYDGEQESVKPNGKKKKEQLIMSRGAVRLDEMRAEK